MSATSTPSIRSIIRNGLLNGLNTAQIGAELKRLHPTSAAAAKVSKHVAFYRAEMVKAGEIAKGTGAMVGGRRLDTPETIAAEIERLQARLVELNG